MRIFRSLNNETSKYWHFKWRFETFDNLTIHVEYNDNNTAVLKLSIQGTYNNFRNNTQNADIEYYVCKIINNDSQSLFNESLVSCFFYNNDMYVSNYIGGIVEPEIKYKFIIGGLGEPKFGASNEIRVIDIEQEKIFKRVKDFKI